VKQNYKTLGSSCGVIKKVGWDKEVVNVLAAVMGVLQQHKSTSGKEG